MKPYFRLGNPALEIFRGHDMREFDTGISALAEDGYVDEIATGERWEGRQGVLGEFERWTSAFSDAHNKIHNVIETPDYTVIEGTWCGTHDGVLNLGDDTIEPTGRELAFPYTTVAKIANGKQQYAHHYYDVGTIMLQLGLR